MIVHVLRTLLLLCLPGALTGSLLPVRTYTTADGLPSNRVSRIVRDARGFLWFCTHDGLSLFDGYQFTNFGIEQGLPPGADDLVTTDEGWYWVATREGLVRFDTTGKGRLFTVYVPPDPDARWITALADDGAGGLWCGTSRGLYHFKGSAVPARGAKWSFAFVDIGMANETPDDRFVTVLLRDRNGEVWVGGYKGIYRGSAGDGLWKRYTTRDGLPDVHVTSLLQARDGSLWVGTWNGLCRLSIREGADPLPIARYDRKRGHLREWWVPCWKPPMAPFGSVPTAASAS